MTETTQSLNEVQFKNIENAVAKYFQFPIFIINMTPFYEDSGETKVFVDVAVAGHPEINGTVEVDTNLNVVER